MSSKVLGMSFSEDGSACFVATLEIDAYFCIVAETCVFNERRAHVANFLIACLSIVHLVAIKIRQIRSSRAQFALSRSDYGKFITKRLGQCRLRYGIVAISGGFFDGSGTRSITESPSVFVLARLRSILC